MKCQIRNYTYVIFYRKPLTVALSKLNLLIRLQNNQDFSATPGFYDVNRSDNNARYLSTSEYASIEYASGTSKKKKKNDSKSSAKVQMIQHETMWLEKRHVVKNRSANFQSSFHISYLKRESAPAEHSI